MPFVSSLCLFAWLHQSSYLPTQSIVHWIDVGQGSALLVQSVSGTVLMIDSGPAGSSEAILHAFQTHDIRKVDLWIHTHFDADHVGGLSRVLMGVDGIWNTEDDIWVAEFWDRGLEQAPTTQAVAVYSELAHNRQQAHPGWQWNQDDIYVKVLNTTSGLAEPQENARGIALYVEVEELRILVPGDLPESQVRMAAQESGPVDILWASHHGSSNGISQEILALTEPQWVVISAGFGNSYCHPNEATLALLKDYQVWIMGAAGITPLEGCVSLSNALAEHHWLGAGELQLLVESSKI